MIHWLRLTRPAFALPIAFTYGLTVYYALGRHAPSAETWSDLLLGSLAMSLLLAAAYAFNDACDAVPDRINAPRRPVAAGRITRLQATRLAILLTIASLLLAACVHWRLLAGFTALAILLALYDRHSKQLGLLKQIAVASLMTSIYPLALLQAGGACGSRAPTLAVFPIWMWFSTWAFETYRDLQHLPGDAAANTSPTPLATHPHRMRQLTDTAFLLAALIAIAPIFLGNGWIYTAFLPLAILVAFAARFAPLRLTDRLVYAHYVLVGLAATLDVAILGFVPSG